MIEQPTLPFAAKEREAIEADRPLTLEQEFENFDAANPHVFEALRREALRVWNRGHKRYGFSILYGIVRYDGRLETSGKPYKLNNNFATLYRDKLIAEEPQLEGMFETRDNRRGAAR